MDYRVTFTAQAERDLEKIVRFLAQKNPAAAERLGYALVDDALSLTNLPFRSVAVQERPGYRRILLRPWFLIFYRIEETRNSVRSHGFGTYAKTPTHSIFRLLLGAETSKPVENAKVKTKEVKFNADDLVGNVNAIFCQCQ